MQDNQTLTKIKAKQQLGLPLDDHDRAMLTLYGNETPENATDADAAAARAELCANIIAPILDVLVPIIDAIALRIKRTSVEETAAAMSEYGKKAAFVEKTPLADVGGGGYANQKCVVPLPHRHERGIRRHHLHRRTQTPRMRNRGLAASVDP